MVHACLVAVRKVPSSAGKMNLAEQHKINVPIVGWGTQLVGWTSWSKTELKPFPKAVRAEDATTKH